MENKGLIKDLLNRFAAADEHSIAFSLYDGSGVTHIPFRKFLEDVLQATGYFVHKEMKCRHIAIAAPNSYDWIVMFLAITGSGNVAVLLNQDLPEEVIERQCGQADVTAICTDCPERFAGLHDTGMECIGFKEIKKGHPAALDDICCTNPDETAAMMFTSGTTGKSKIAVFTAYNLRSILEDLEEILSLPSLRSALLTFPLYHISGLITVISLLRVHKRICIGRGIRYLLTDIPVLNPSFIPMVPAALNSLVKLLKTVKSEEERRKYIGSDLAVISVSGASVNPSLCRYMMDLGIEVRFPYGMTESAGAGTNCIWKEDNIGSIGKPYGKTECRIVDGELLLRSPSVMKGYYKDPEETAKILEDGWLHTGDLAYCDENGYYYLTGRKKNVMILSNGENVNPEEIEAAFSECPEILESMVYNDAKGICADVYTKEKAACAAFIRKYNDSVPLYRQVYKVNYSAAPLKKTGTGKIKRKENAYV